MKELTDRLWPLGGDSTGQAVTDIQTRSLFLGLKGGLGKAPGLCCGKENWLVLNVPLEPYFSI